MAVPERPQLRPHLACSPEDQAGRYFLIHDQLRLNGGAVRVNALELRWVTLFDGSRTLREVQFEAMQALGGQIVPLERFQRLADNLDKALFLEGPRYRAGIDAWMNNPVRQPSCVGTYEADPDALRRRIERLFTAPDGPGVPGAPRPDGRLRAALVPHMDYGRGGRTYAHGYKEVFENTSASLFVIIGTSHYSPHRFTLTRKHFQTPLGVAQTDQGYIDRLVAHYGDGLFADELRAHLPEHSIELEVVFLQYLYPQRPFRIVPLLVGSFQDCVDAGRSPAEAGDVGRMIEALRAAERETPEPICYLISGDLAHIGPKFDDDRPAAGSWLEESRTQDQAILRQTEAADPAGYFRVIANEGNARRICGLAPTYLVLEALRPASGKVLHYHQYVHPLGHESVSFASVAFYR